MRQHPPVTNCYFLPILFVHNCFCTVRTCYSIVFSCGKAIQVSRRDEDQSSVEKYCIDVLALMRSQTPDYKDLDA